MIANPRGLGPEKDCAGKDRQHIQNTDPSFRQRGRPTKTRRQLSNSNKYLVVSPRWGSTPRLTDWGIWPRLHTGYCLKSKSKSKSKSHCDWRSVNRSPASRRMQRKGKSRIWDSNIGREYHGIRTREWLRWRLVAIVNDRPILSSETAAYINKPATVWV
jgi:hypothetical protein